MSKQRRIPVYDICSLQKEEHRRKDDFLIEPFAAYLERHPNLMIPHRHSFYHMVLFSAGNGTHTIDFEQFTVKPGQVYFMIPGQVHSWQFNGTPEGYIINCSESFLCAGKPPEAFTSQFPFLDGIASRSVIQLGGHATTSALRLMEEMLLEEQQQQALYREKIQGHLTNLLITALRECEPEGTPAAQKTQRFTFLQFRRLLEQHFGHMRLPREYAAMLHVTPNHLNALCRELVGKSAGILIRDRVVLEAKRLLVNADMSVSEIAWQLHFADNSYFTRFFRKHTGLTPEAFRKSVITPTRM